MARDIQRFAATFPIGGSPSNLTIVPMIMPARIVRRITINVPPGPRGELNIALAAAGIRFLPSNAGGFLQPDDDKIDWLVEGVIESGAWQMIGYNTGNFPHTVEVLFLCDLPPRDPTNSAETPLTVAELGAIIGTAVT